MKLEQMSKPQRRNKGFGIEYEEERAWVSFYARAHHDAAVAAEVLAQLEADPALKRERLALYLTCKESLKAYKARVQRNKRIGYAVRRSLNAAFCGTGPRRISKLARRLRSGSRMPAGSRRRFADGWCSRRT